MGKKYCAHRSEEQRDVSSDFGVPSSVPGGSFGTLRFLLAMYREQAQILFLRIRSVRTRYAVEAHVGISVVVQTSALK